MPAQEASTEAGCTQLGELQAYPVGCSFFDAATVTRSLRLGCLSDSSCALLLLPVQQNWDFNIPLFRQNKLAEQGNGHLEALFALQSSVLGLQGSQISPC
jgi:hypothetical protein